MTTLKNKKVLPFAILLIVFLFGVVKAAQFAYENRCHVIVCSPVSWEEIKNIAIAQAGDDFRMENISALPAHWTRYSDEGPEFIDITITYISLTQDDRQHTFIDFPIKYLEFDDRRLNLFSRSGSSWSNHIPPEDGKERFERVIVHPRDAFRLTWKLAEKESLQKPQDAHVSALLVFNEIDKKFGCESIWGVYYYFDNVAITFFINAQTAEIISMGKN